ncbi:MAG: hypothetical protein Q4F56_02995 [Candidatus Saccharibacteria bacterium]|nr:hypothetical protein [Candidatus Saccharibacteria bacterium]
MMQKTISLTTSRQITLPSALIKKIGAEPGSKLVARYDEKENAILLERQKTLEESLVILEKLREEEIRKNPRIAENIKRHAGWEYEDYRKEWDNSPEGEAYYKERYGL